ncbi:MAG: DUF2806 domain-containing protein [Akkermansia sp.]|nr:DUF2806 domain-containing protein [Akkermansia sp.]
MSEIETSDLLGLSAPLTKLVETVAAGIGRLYEPTHIRRMAKAKAEEINLISEAIRQNPELPVRYEDGKLFLDGTDCTELARRAQERFLFQEFKKQNNLDHIVAEAAKTLDETPSVDARKVDDDWISHFFDAAAHVSNEEMQQLWGKLLAGEITTNGSFSIRTLDLLRSFSKNDAELFCKVAALFMHIDNDYFITDNISIYNKYGISYGNLLELSSLGMIQIHPFQCMESILEKNETATIQCHNDHLIIANTGDQKISIKLDCYFITKPAEELYTLLKIDTTQGYLKEIENEIKNNLNTRERQQVNIKFHQQA